MAKKILIVDDEPGMLRLMEMALSPKGYHVVTAADGEEALKKARAEKPDLIITDLVLPKLDGWRVCQKLKSEPAFKSVPIILSSGLLDDASAKGDSDLGDGYLAKPFESSDLIAKVEELLNKQ